MDAQAVRGMPALPGTQTVSPLTEARVSPLPSIEWTTEQRVVSELYSQTGDLGNAVSTMLRVPELGLAALVLLALVVPARLDGRQQRVEEGQREAQD